MIVIAIVPIVIIAANQLRMTIVITIPLNNVATDPTIIDQLSANKEFTTRGGFLWYAVDINVRRTLNHLCSAAILLSRLIQDKMFNAIPSPFVSVEIEFRHIR